MTFRIGRALTHLPAQALIGLVHGYRLLLRPWLGNVCRYAPTCSAYALQALAHHGATKGTLLTAGRILRCHPWCAGGLDPVPAVFPNPVAGLFTRFGAEHEIKAQAPCPPTRNPP